jgi:hypothetical protein
MADQRRPPWTENLEGWEAMRDSLIRRVAEAFEAVSEDDMRALQALDDFESGRIEARRRYEEFIDLPAGPVG